MLVEKSQAEANLFAEYELLKQPEGGIRDQIPGYDPYAARRSADEELKSFNVLVDTVHNNPDVVPRPLDAIYERQFLFEFLANYTRALETAGFTRDRRPFRSKEELSEFLESMPSRRVATMLQFHYLKDVGKHWKINDLRDNVAPLPGHPLLRHRSNRQGGLGPSGQPGTSGQRVRYRYLASAD